MHPKGKASVWGKRRLVIMSAVIVITALVTLLVNTLLQKAQSERIAGSSLYDHAKVFGEQGQYQAAIDELDRAIHIDPKQPEYYALKASMLYQIDSSAHHLRQTLQYLDQAIDLAKAEQKQSFLEERIRIYRKLKWFENILTDLDRLIDLTPDPVTKIEYLLRRAEILQTEMSEFEAAFREYERAMALADNRSSVEILVLQALLRLSLYNEEEQELEQILKLYRQAFDQMKSVQPGQSEALELASTIWNSLHVLSSTERLAFCMEYYTLFAPIAQQQIPDEDVFMEAFDEFAKAKQLDKKQATYHALKAQYFDATYPWEDRKTRQFVIDEYSKAIRLVKNEAQKDLYLRARARLWDAQGKYDRAEKDWESVLTAKAFHMQRGAFYDSLGRYSQAERHYRKVMDRKAYYTQRANFYDAVNEYSRADRCWRKVLPKKEFYEQRAAYYDQQQRYSRADLYYKKLLPRMDFYIERAAFYSHKNSYHEAANLLDQLIRYARKKDRKNLSKYYVLRAANYDALGMYEEADADYEKAFDPMEFKRERARFYFCQGMTHRDKEKKFEMLRKAERYYDDWEGADISMEIERIYFYKMMNRKKKLKAKVHWVKQHQHEYADDFLDSFLEKHTLDFYHKNGVDPCQFSEILTNPLLLTQKEDDV